MSDKRITEVIREIQEIFPDFPTKKRRSSDYNDAPPHKCLKNPQSDPWNKYDESCESERLNGTFHLFKHDDDTYTLRRVQRNPKTFGSQKVVETANIASLSSNSSRVNGNESNDISNISLVNGSIVSIDLSLCDRLNIEGNFTDSECGLETENTMSSVGNVKPDTADDSSHDIKNEDIPQHELFSPCRNDVTPIDEMPWKMWSHGCQTFLEKFEEKYTEKLQVQQQIAHLLQEEVRCTLHKQSIEVDDFPILSAHHLQIIDDAIKPEGDENDYTELITRGSIVITREDIRRLQPNNLLNEQIIDFYMNLLVERGELRSKDGYPKIFAMSSLFLCMYKDDKYESVSGLTKNVDLFDCDIILVPVNVNGIHWCLVVISMIEKTIKFYDSLMGHDDDNEDISNEWLSLLEKYLQEESLNKRNIEFDLSGWSKVNVTDHPQQRNNDDCGVFVCLTAEFICRKRPIRFTYKHMDNFRKRMIFEICEGKLLL